MICQRKLITFFIFGVAALFISCLSAASASELNEGTAVKTNSSDDWRAGYLKLSNTDGKVFALNPKLSSVRIYVFPGGIVPTWGHNHVLLSPNFTGFVYLPGKGTSNARFDLEFRLDQLEIDNPDERSKLGEAFSSTLGPDVINTIREHMLGENNLQAELYPLVHIHCVRIAGEIPKLVAEVQIDLHGQQKTMTMPLSVEYLPNRLTATGAFVFRQSDFGIHPYSILGGIIEVLDEVIVEFSLVGTD